MEGEDPLAPFSPTAAEPPARADGFPHVADIMVNSFYDPELDEGCAFEELISFHGGMGGSQTRPFIMYPVRLSSARGADLGRRGRPCHPRGVARDAAGTGGRADRG